MVRKMIPITIMIRIAAIAMTALALFGGGVVVGKKYVQGNWDAEAHARTAAESAAILTRVKNNERQAEQQLLDNRKIKKVNQDEIRKIHAGYATTSRLRVPASVCNRPASGAEADSASGSNGATAGTVALPDKIESDLYALMRDADVIVAQCRAAQEFIRANGMAP